MTSRLACITATWLASSSLAAQQLVPESVKVQRSNPMAALGGRTLVVLHLKPYRTDSGYRFAAGDSMGRVEPYPAHLSRNNDGALARADSLYRNQRYREAAAVLERAYGDEPTNPFVLNAYARTLFWIDDRRDQSLDVYRRLIALLDQKGGTNDSVVFVDLWFHEAYWKIASLYLDRGDYKTAAFEITRFLAAPGPRESPVLNQAIDFLVEAYAHLDNDELVRLWAKRALSLNARDAQVLSFLYQMGSRATSRLPTDVLACRPAADTLPPVGAYSFFRQGATVRCVAPRGDDDETVAPCLRVGEVYVGERRDEVEGTLGAPQRSLPQRNGTVAYMYLVFFDGSQRGAYYVIEYESAEGSEIVRSLQLTRDRPPLPLDFSCVLLGDPAERLTRQVGPPARIAPFDDASIAVKGQQWTYGPLPFSAEIVDNRVYSIRVWRPDALPPKRRRFKFAEPS